MIDIDTQLERWIVGHRVGMLDPLFVGLSYAGSFAVVWLAIGAALSIRRRTPEPLAWVLVAAVTANLVADRLQELFGRDRPPVRFAEPEALVHVPAGGSFPSVHATTSFACAAVLARLAPRWTPWLLVLAAAISCSRVYVGVHYPLDVLAGAALGLALATALRWLAAVLPRSRRARRAG